jgi:hypothetical protein
VPAVQVANAELVAARDSALEEAAAAADETKRLAAEVARLKDELGETQEQLSNAKVGTVCMLCMRQMLGPPAQNDYAHSFDACK